MLVYTRIHNGSFEYGLTVFILNLWDLKGTKRIPEFGFFRIHAIMRAYAVKIYVLFSANRYFLFAVLILKWLDVRL